MPTLTPDLIEKLNAVAASKGISLEALLWQWLALYWERTAQSATPTLELPLQGIAGIIEVEITNASEHSPQALLEEHRETSDDPA